MIIKLTKLSNNENKWVDGMSFKDGRVGYCNTPPQMGNQFTMFTVDDGKQTGYITTTPIKSIEFFDDRHEFNTQNSRYRVDVLPEDTI